MKPIIIVPPDLLEPAEIQKLNDNDLCVVVAKDPAKVRFLDPIPAASSRTQIENAAIKLSRILLNGQWSGSSLLGRGDFARLYVELLVNGTPLDANPTQVEQERTIFNQEKADELRRLARAEAKVDRLRMAEEKKATKKTS